MFQNVHQSKMFSCILSTFSIGRKWTTFMFFLFVAATGTTVGIVQTIGKRKTCCHQNYRKFETHTETFVKILFSFN